MQATMMNMPPFLLWALSGFLFFLAFLHPVLWWTTVPAIVFFLHASIAAERIRALVLGSVLAGTCKAAGGLVWIWHAYPVTVLGLDASIAQMILILVYWLLDAASIGVTMSACALGIRVLVRHRSWLVVTFPILFVCAEIMGSFTSSAYSLGPGAGINVHFGFGYIGYLAASAPFFLPFAVFGGVYALSFVLASFGLGTYIILYCAEWPRFRRVATRVLISVLFVSGSVAWLLLPDLRADTLDRRVIVIDTNFTPELLATTGGHAFKRWQVTRAVTAALAHEPDLVLLPEDSRFVERFESPQDALVFVKDTASTDVIVVDSSRITDESGNTTLRAFYFDTARNTIHTIDKQRLVPQGEYVPYLISGLLSVLGEDEFLAKLNRNQSYRPGARTTYDTFPTEIPSMLFCFESAVPFGVRAAIRPDATSLVLHSVSHGWFHQTFLLQPQLTNMLRVQAVWNGATIVSAANMASNAAYLPDGSVIHGSLIQESEYWDLYAF